MAHIYKSATALEFDTASSRHTYRALKLDDTHFLAVWSGNANDGFAQVFQHTAEGATTALGTALEFDATDLTYNDCCLLDATHAFVVWQRSAAASLIVVLTWDANWTVTVASLGGAVTYSVDNHNYQRCVKVDATHALVVFSDATNGADGFAIVFAIDANYDLAAVGSVFEYDATGATWMAVARVGLDANSKFLTAHRQSATAAIVKVLDVAADYAVTTASPGDVTFEATNPSHVWAVPLDPSHVLLTWCSAAAAEAQVMAVDLSTWAVSAVGSACVLETTYITGSASNGLYTTNFWRETTDAWWCLHAGEPPADAGILLTILRVDKLTYAVTEQQGALTIPISTAVPYPVIVDGPQNRAIVVWAGADGDGFAQSFVVKEQRDQNTLLWTFLNNEASRSPFVDIAKIFNNGLEAESGDYANRLKTELTQSDDYDLTQVP